LSAAARRERIERIERLQARLLAQASIEPVPDWLPVLLAGERIGTARADVASELASTDARCALLDYCLVFDDEALDRPGRSALLNDLAVKLHEAGLLRGWRNEQLDVRPLADAPAGAVLATIERAACRALGIATHAVHLNAFAPDGRLWVAQRAAHKSVDPDLWDNLVGGMVSAGEPELLALEREAHEEAGLSLHGLAVRRGVLLREQRPLPEGHMVETVQVFDAVLPPGFVPRSVDGEVQRFELRSADAVLSAIERGEFTIEAALVALDGLLRQEAHHD
jgi:8-oxo-dGTP pyrophosphatase MutT (NUDIX family)